MKVTTDACLFGAWVADKEGACKTDSNQLALDIGTGTGLLALMLAQKTGMQIDAIDLDEGAFQQARENIAASPWPGRISAFGGDITRFPLEKKYAIILSNPPFYERELKSPDERVNKARHEGLNLSRLLEVIENSLAADGRFYLLLPFKRIEDLKISVAKAGMSLTTSCLVKQSPSHPFFRVMIEGRKKDSMVSTRSEEITIKKSSQEYTEEFSHLLKDYYLYL